MLARNMMLFIATTIVLLHSIIPHSHHSELSAEQHLQEHENASSILDYLSLAFHLDHEDGQFEDFTPGQYSTPQHLQPFLNSPQVLAIEIQTIAAGSRTWTSLEPVFVDRSAANSSGLRAPPTLS